MITLPPNPSWLGGVEYDSRTRRHRLDGRPVPSVTQAIGVAYPDRFAHVPPATLARKAAIGTAVHQAAHYLANDDLDETSLAPEVRPRVEAWQWFTSTRRVEPILVEAVVCSRDLAFPAARRRPFVGRLDLLAVVDRRQVVLVDLKTGVPSLAGLQTLAYLDALYQQYPTLIAADVARWAVVVTPEGRYAVHPFRDERGDADAWRRVLTCAYSYGAEWTRDE